MGDLDPLLLSGALNMLTTCGGPMALPSVLQLVPAMFASMDNFTALQETLQEGNTDFWTANGDLLTLLRCAAPPSLLPPPPPPPPPPPHLRSPRARRCSWQVGAAERRADGG